MMLVRIILPSIILPSVFIVKRFKPNLRNSEIRPGHSDLLFEFLSLGFVDLLQITPATSFSSTHLTTRTSQPQAWINGRIIQGIRSSSRFAGG
jgi:hypothetical protein